ncbi:fatty acid-binding protein, liver-like [Watersipora subatra]|uniref:fatty acid-binding protein, liver-like n=1 Tax=Watersipora subatra TaxID=2589382 RepID=UPI00355C8F44
MEKYLGSWKSQESEGFEDYLKALGVALPLRKIASMQNPRVSLTDDGDGLYTVVTATTFKTHTVQFKLGEELDESTPDGRDVKTVFHLDDEGKLVQTQMLKGEVSSKLAREIIDGKLKITATAGTAVYIRTYVKE